MPGSTSGPFSPPANEVCEGYVFTPVCHSVQRGRCLGPGPGGRLGGLARGVSRPRPRGEVGGSGWGSRLTPGGVQAHTQGGVGWVSRPTPGDVQAQAQRGCIPTCTEADSPPPPQTATAAGGTHPTGMHSCHTVFGEKITK